MKTPNTPQGNSSDESSAFGYETVSHSEKTRKVRGVFDSVALKYD